VSCFIYFSFSVLHIFDIMQMIVGHRVGSVMLDLMGGRRPFFFSNIH